jgi:hypothetical protein
MSDTQETDRIRFSQVLAGALAAVTAALLGSTMGVAGTVVGAGLASVISTVGGALYLRSFQRTREGVRTVHAKVVGRSGGTTVLVSDKEPEEGETPEELSPGDEVEVTPDDQPPAERRRLKWPVLVVTTLAAFALGMAAVTGVEWLRGESLSGSGDTTFGSIVSPRQHTTTGEDPADPTTPTTTPTTTTTTPDPTTTTDPTTTSTTPPSDSSTTTGPTTTTTTSPETTTTDEATPGGTVPPSN